MRPKESVPRLVVSSGVEHESRVNVLENAGLCQNGLAAAAFLGRGAHHQDGAGDLGPGAVQGHGRPHRGRGDEVVAAAVTDFGQGVVFSQKGQLGFARFNPLGPGAKGGFHASHGRFRLKILFGQDIRSASYRPAVLDRRFPGFRISALGQADNLLGQTFHIFQYPLFDLGKTSAGIVHFRTFPYHGRGQEGLLGPRFPYFQKRLQPKIRSFEPKAAYIGLFLKPFRGIKNNKRYIFCLLKLFDYLTKINICPKVDNYQIAPAMARVNLFLHRGNHFRRIDVGVLLMAFVHAHGVATMRRIEKDKL